MFHGIAILKDIIHILLFCLLHVCIYVLYTYTYNIQLYTYEYVHYCLSSIYISLYLFFIYLSIFLFIYLSSLSILYLSIFLFIYLYLLSSDYLYIYLSVSFIYRNLLLYCYPFYISSWNLLMEVRKKKCVLSNRMFCILHK